MCTKLFKSLFGTKAPVLPTLVSTPQPQNEVNRGQDKQKQKEMHMPGSKQNTQKDNPHGNPHGKSQGKGKGKRSR